jgi:hypothetical protein
MRSRLLAISKRPKVVDALSFLVELLQVHSFSSLRTQVTRLLVN